MNRKQSIGFLLGVLLLFTVTGFSEEGKHFRPRLSIKLSGGAGFAAVGDLNDSLDTSNAFFQRLNREYPNSVSGKIKSLSHWMADWEAELRIDITPNIGLDVATSAPFHKKNESFLIYKGALGIEGTYDFKPRIDVSMPLRLGAYFTVPYSRRINCFLNVGIAHYSGKIAEYFDAPNYLIGFYSVANGYWETQPKGSWGLNGGIGLEYRLKESLVLVVELQGRNVRIKNLGAIMKGEMSYDGHNEGSREERGTLDYFFWSPGPGFSYLGVYIEQPPWGTIPEKSYRRAILDLSGYSLRMGIRLKLF